MAELLTVERLFADGYHNAFTDLCRWRGHYYLCFRTAQTHGVDPPGDVVVYRSAHLADGAQADWELCARLDTGADDRDPKLIDAGDRLGVSFGSWFPRWRGKGVPSEPWDLITHLSTTRDGLAWSQPRQVYGVNYWLWRILPAEGGFYCPAYHFGVRGDRDMRTVHLLRSEDLFDWRLIGLMRSGGGPGEPVLYQPGPGVLECVARTLEPRHHSWLGRSRAPYTEWSWQDLGVMIHAPVVLQVGDRRIVAGRSQEEDLPPGSFLTTREQVAQAGHHTSVWELVDGEAEHVLTVPSIGDNSYCGLAPDPTGEVALSYYSQHERLPIPSGPPTPADVYLARFRL